MKFILFGFSSTKPKPNFADILFNTRSVYVYHSIAAIFQTHNFS
jgi:hypothetical protein